MQRCDMNRRAFAVGLGSMIAGLPSVGLAEGQRTRPHWVPWKKVPSIAVMSIVHDSRLPAVDKAVEFWNATLSGLGSPFRLGSIAHIPEIVRYESVLYYALHGREFQIAFGGWPANAFEFPRRIAKISDDIIIVLTTTKAAPFTASDRSSRKVIIVIGGSHFNTWQDVLNVVAHELGHVVGLDHNDDPNALMCGDIGDRPQCRVGSDLASSDVLPLTISDQRKLLDMYPPYWPEETPPRPWLDDPPVLPNVRFGGRMRAGAGSDY